MDEYFDAFDRIAALKQSGEFADAFAIAISACEQIPHDHYRNPGPPCDYLALYAITYQYREPLDRFASHVRSLRLQKLPDEYGANWSAFLEWSSRAYGRFGEVLKILQQSGPRKQNDLQELVGGDKRELSNLLYWADRFGVVNREKVGRTYLVDLPL